MSEPESELVAWAARGDRAAMQRLLIRHHERLLNHINDRVPADVRGLLSAEDVCQETYVAMFQQITTLRDRSARTFASWLQAIAERKLIDAVRALRARKRGGTGRAAGRAAADVSSVIELLDLVAVDEHTPSRSLARRELIAGVRAAIDELKEDHRAALRLHYLEGRTVDETARRMGRSGGAVVMLCHRALRQLARVLERRRDA
ncbi:MAG: sigma-70 family RNA polymerase sigma factor [Planctomycetes bacterium]|nr:sigma-70 family RNA polymerase sigma factor [Planctomycetota bacterium]